MMKGIAIGVGVACLLVASVAFGWNFNFSISGSLLLHPVQYSGTFTSGATGTLQYTLNDTGWPDPADPGARFSYIWTTYFASNYDNSVPGAEKWVGQIPGRFSITTTAAPAGYVGYCEGGINAKYTVRDMDADGVLDEEEKIDWNNMLDGRLTKLCADPSSGQMLCKQGFGALNSNLFGFPTPPELNTLNGTGNLTLFPCASETEPCSWGSVKSLYK